MNPQAQSRTGPGGLNREEDAVADIIKLEDKSPPAPLNNAHQKFANVSSISNQVKFFFGHFGMIIFWVSKFLDLWIFWRSFPALNKTSLFPFLR